MSSIFNFPNQGIYCSAIYKTGYTVEDFPNVVTSIIIGSRMVVDLCNNKLSLILLLEQRGRPKLIVVTYIAHAYVVESLAVQNEKSAVIVIFTFQTNNLGKYMNPSFQFPQYAVK